MSSEQSDGVEAALRYAPVSTLPSDRPALPPEQCPACGAEVDPLRAPCALAFDDGVRVLCSEACATKFRNGERVRRRVELPSGKAATATATTTATAVFERTSATQAAPDSLAPAAVKRQRERRAELASVWLGATTLGTAALLTGFGSPETARGALVLCALSALAGLRLTWPAVGDTSLLGYALAPCGVVLAGVLAYADAAVAQLHFSAFAGVLAAGALWGRGVLDTFARRPLATTRAQLQRTLPSHVYVPDESEGDAPGALRTCATEAIRVGEEIVAAHGERLGVDGVVRAGEADISPYPGATQALHRSPGDVVLAGAAVSNGAVRVLASRIGDDRAIARVARVGDADERAPASLARPVQRALPWFALLCALVCAGLCIASHVRGLPWPWAAVSAILIAAPVLALRRAAEWPLRVAATAASQRGILFQSGAALELAGSIKTVVLSPHRTLTDGKAELLDLHTFGDEPQAHLLALAAGAELSAGDHPIGRAIVRYADLRGIAPSEMRRAKAIAGRGITGTGPDGEDIILGSRRLLLDEGVSVAIADTYAARIEASGRSVVFMAVSGRVRAVFALQNQLRPGARAAVQRMFDLGLEVVVVTGDQRGPVEQLAASFDIAHIKCELLPEERAQEVRNLRDAGGPVAVIGYPTEDAAALSAADVAIVIGAASGGSGDHTIALLSEDLRDTAAALWVARAARASVRGTLRMSLLAFIVLTTAASAGLISVGLSALLALLIDAHGIHAGARLLRRLSLRLGSNR